MKDLHDPSYWETFGNLGFAIGKKNVPTPREIADTYARLVREKNDALAVAEEAMEKARIALFQVDTFLLEASNRAADLGHQLRNTAKVSNTAMGAKLREIRQRAIDNGMELQSADEIIREARNG